MQATCSLSADVFAGAETTLKERRLPEQKSRQVRISARRGRSLLSLARPGQVQPADISEAFVVLVTMCFSRSLASTNVRAGCEVRPRTRAARRRRTRMQSGLGDAAPINPMLPQMLPPEPRFSNVTPNVTPEPR